jgi:predicted unusual protein kinase regulating ubiquinone biosynthesis (AarF/ABC1/UbiB family)
MLRRWLYVAKGIIQIIKDAFVWCLYSQLLRIDYSPKDYVRLIENQGAVCIKLFQTLSQRDNLFSDDMKKELGKLRDDVTPHSFSHTKQSINKELSNEWKRKIKSINAYPIASGSVAQVHKGYLTNGKIIVVKVLHPNVDEQVEASIFLIESFFTVLSLFGIHRFSSNNDFYTKMIDQLDLTTEKYNLSRFEETFQDFSMVKVPDVLFASKSLLVESFEYGVPLEKFMRNYPIFSEEALSLLMNVYHYMCFDANFIHGDPHTGNFLFRLNNGVVEIVILDAGIVFELKKDEVKHMRRCEIVPFIFDWSRIPTFVREMNINPLANLNSFEQQYNESLRFYIKKVEKIKKGDFNSYIFHELCDIGFQDKPSARMFSMCYDAKIKIEGNFLFYLLYTNSLIFLAFGSSVYKHTLIHDIVSYGVKKGFLTSTELLDTIIKQKTTMNMKWLQKVV